MHIELDRDDATFSTLCGPLVKHRALIVRIAGKPFFTCRSVEGFREKYDPQYMEYIDKLLIESIGRVLTKVLEKACLEVSDGVELIMPEEDEKITAQANDVMHQWYKPMTEGIK